MIDIKNKTLFFRPLNSNNNIIYNEVFKFFELNGDNILVVLKDKISFNCVNKFGNTIYFYNSNIGEKVSENLFRVNIIYVICHSHQVDEYYEDIRRFTDIPIVFGVERLPNPDKVYKMISNSDAAYLFESEKNSNTFNFTYCVKDLKNNWKSSLNDLKTAWIRNKKLDDLLR